jgi:hypothetical protein
MKKRIFASLLLLTLTVSLFGLSLEFTDTQPSPNVTGYGVFRLIGTNWMQIGGVATSTNAVKRFDLNSLNLGAGTYTFGASATNAMRSSDLAMVSTNLPAKPATIATISITTTDGVIYSVTGQVLVQP